MTTATQTATVRDEAVQVFIHTMHHSTANSYEQQVKAALTAALPHLALSAAPCSVEVNREDIHLIERLAYGYEVMFETLCHIAGTSGGSTSWYTGKAQETTRRISPLHSLTVDGNKHQNGEYKPQHKKFMEIILSQIVTKPVDVAAVWEALEWYAEQVQGCRKITSEGDKYRDALDADGGNRARTALCALSTAEPVDQWQDMQTAPKDWSDILLYVPDLRSDHRNVCEGFYYVEQEEWRSVEFGVLKPTHWMPLPAAPTSKGGE